MSVKKWLTCVHGWQEVFVHLQYICMKKEQEKVINSEVQDAFVRKLLIFLQQALGGSRQTLTGDTEQANNTHSCFRELEIIRHRDIGVNQADQDHFSAYTNPPQLRDTPGGNEAITITTYGALVITILQHVNYCIAKPLVSARPDSSPGEADAAVLKEICSACKQVVVSALLFCLY